MSTLFAVLVLLTNTLGQGQNPSPMVEHTRAHPRLTKGEVPGQREKLGLGTLFLPETLSPTDGKVPLVIHFHGADWLVEQSAIKVGNLACIAMVLGSGSRVYGEPFKDPARFGMLLAEAEDRAKLHFEPITLSGWSAGYGAIREILKVPEYHDRVDRVILIDGLHTGYPDGKPGPLESKIDPEPLEVFLQFAREAKDGKKRMVITHTEIFPGTFASTTETTNWLLGKLELRRQPLLRWGPMGMQQTSEAREKGFLLRGYAGNSAPDHVDQLHALSTLLTWPDAARSPIEAPPLRPPGED